MSFFAEHLLSLIVFVPLVGALLALSFPSADRSGVRGFALALTLFDLFLAGWMWARFEPSNTGLQLVESIEWIPTFGIRYALGVDGLSVSLVLLTAGLAPLVVLSTYSSVTQRIREYLVCLLLLQTGMLGAFLASDLFLFYVFWELMLIPMYFLIGIWGGPRRVYAALKFFLYTMGGSLLMLVAILYTVFSVRDAGGLSFGWQDIHERLAGRDLGGAETWLFLAFAVAFAIKVPLFPFHTWLPDAHVEAPTGGSVVLAGVLLKLGVFGLLRYALWLFPAAAVEFLPALALLSVVGIVYGALVAMVQDDLKRLVAYSSVSHLGFIVLGVAALSVAGVTGGVVQMVNHGVSTGALFLLVGVLYERRHTRLIADYGGVARVMPWYTFVWVLIVLSSIGVPGLNGFVGELLVMVGAFESVGIQLSTPTGEVAWAGVIAVMLVAAASVVLVALAVRRAKPDRAQVGAVTRALVIGAALVAAVVVAAPPWGDFGGGLLVRPLAGLLDSDAAFSEVLSTLAVIAATGVIFAAVYLLWATQRVFFGPLRDPANQALHDLSLREMVILAPLCLAAVGAGVYPRPLLDAVEPTVTQYASRIREAAKLPPLRVASRTREQALPGVQEQASPRPAGPPHPPVRRPLLPGRDEANLVPGVRGKLPGGIPFGEQRVARPAPPPGTLMPKRPVLGTRPPPRAPVPGPTPSPAPTPED